MLRTGMLTTCTVTPEAGIREARLHKQGPAFCLQHSKLPSICERLRKPAVLGRVPLSGNIASTNRLS